jgi:hypothetical protein
MRSYSSEVGGLPKMVVYRGSCPHLLLLFPTYGRLIF